MSVSVVWFVNYKRDFLTCTHTLLPFAWVLWLVYLVITLSVLHISGSTSRKNSSHTRTHHKSFIVICFLPKMIKDITELTGLKGEITFLNSCHPFCIVEDHPFLKNKKLCPFLKHYRRKFVLYFVITVWSIGFFFFFLFPHPTRRVLLPPTPL